LRSNDRHFRQHLPVHQALAGSKNESVCASQTSRNLYGIFQGIFNVEGLITGANLQEAQRIVVLSGYSSMLQPFLYLLYDYPERTIFQGTSGKFR
jgi:hypothetical protein